MRRAKAALMLVERGLVKIMLYFVLLLLKTDLIFIHHCMSDYN